MFINKEFVNTFNQYEVDEFNIRANGRISFLPQSRFFFTVRGKIKSTTNKIGSFPHYRCSERKISKVYRKIVYLKPAKHVVH